MGTTTVNRASGDRADDSYVDLYNHAKQLTDAGDERGATALLEDLCRRYPNHAPAWSRLAYLRARGGDHRGALAAAQRAISCDSECASGHINAGVAALELGDLPTARRYLEEAVRLDPSHCDALRNYALVLARLGEPHAALDAYVRAIGNAGGREPIIAWCTQGVAAVVLPSPPDEPLAAFLDGVRHLRANALAPAYRSLERVRDHPLGSGVRPIRVAAIELIGEVWRRCGRIAPPIDEHEARGASITFPRRT